LERSEAWALLEWVESAASLVGEEGRADLVELTAFALSILEASPIDRRERMVVARPLPAVQR
jgi:hypothetical protein